MTIKLGISQRDRRTLIVGVSVVGTVLAIGRGLPAVSDWESTQRREAESTAERLAQLRDGLRSLPALRDSLRARTARLAELDTTLIRGVSPAAIAAAFASALGDIADENALRVSTLQLRSDSVATQGLARVEVRVTGVTDVAGLAGFLRAVEGNAMPARVRELNISQPEPLAGEAKPETLRVDVLVEGLGVIITEARE